MTAQFEDRNSGLRQVISENSRLTTQSEHNAVPDILHAVRQHLKMDVAFVAEFIEGHRVFRYVDSEWAENPVQAGFSHPLEETYCQRVVDKRLPELMQNAQENPVAVTLALTASVPIGAYLSVPLRLSDGSLYGTFCCFSHSADYSLNERDLSLMRTFAELAAKIIDRERLYQCKTNADRERIANTLKNNTLSMVYQPIFDLIAKQIVGFESLMRFPDAGIRTSEHWFNEAHVIGLGVELETRAISLALEILPFLKKDTYLTINTSPELIMAGALEKLLSNPLDLNHLVLEITEHAIVYQYKEIAAMLAPFRKRGLQIAVDDAGAGYASFRHILNLAPDRIKLDMSLTRDIDTDPARRALTVAFVHFSSNTGSKLIAEGVETAAELATLQALGVTGAQGYFLARPMTMDDVLNKPWHEIKPSSTMITNAPDRVG